VKSKQEIRKEVLSLRQQLARVNGGDALVHAQIGLRHSARAWRLSADDRTLADARLALADALACATRAGITANAP